MFYSIITELFRRIGFLDSQFVYSDLENYSFTLEQIKLCFTWDSYLPKAHSFCADVRNDERGGEWR